MNLHFIAVALVAVPLAATAAIAQSDPMATLHAAAANQLGVLEYCHARGDTDSAAIDAQRSVMAKLPPAPEGSTDAAETTGKQGTISINGAVMSLASVASDHNTTVPALCKQMADTVVQSAKSMAGMMAMPATPPATP
jgi:hypothetical protein